MRCDRCGLIDHVLLDGYAVGDRLLEGVLFEIRKQSNGTFVATTQAKDQTYMSGLNEKRWLKAMAKYAAEADQATCPKCSGDVDWPQ
jgi:hypothetical protein